MPSVLVIGEQHEFAIEESFETDSTVAWPAEYWMTDARGRTFADGEVGRGRLLWLRVDPGDRFATVHVTVAEENVDQTCTRTISKRVRAKNRVYFPSRCFDLRFKPRNVIVACGDGNFQLRQMRWSKWNPPTARGRGIGLINDCVPYCAAGHFHRVPIRVQLSGRRRCANADRYVYTLMKWRFTQRLSWLRESGRVPFPCRLLDL